MELEQRNHKRIIKKMILEQQKELEISLSYFVDKEIVVFPCTNPGIEKINILSLQLSKKVSKVGESIWTDKLVKEIFFFSYLLSRTVSIESINDEKLKEIKGLLDQYSHNIPTEDRTAIQEVIDAFDDFFNAINPDEELNKYTILKEDIEKSSSHYKTTILSRNVSENNDILKDKLISELDNVSQIEVYDNHKNLDSAETLYIGGWLRAKDVEDILCSNKFKTIKILLYPSQINWIKTIIKKVNNRFNDYDIKSMGSLFNLESKTTESIQHGNYLPEIKIPDEYSNYPILTPIKDIDEDDIDISEYEYNINRRKRSGRLNTEDNGEINEPATMVDFYDDYYGFFTENHKFFDVTDIIKGNTKENTKHISYIDDLSVGSYILIFETEKDLVEEKSKNEIRKNGEDWVLEYSTMWSSMLKELHELFDRNYTTLFTVLRGEGLTIQSKATLKNWVRGKTIEPEDDKNIKVIGEAAKKLEGIKFSVNPNNLIKDREKILKACDRYKYYRIKISHAIRHTAFKAIVKQNLSQFDNFDLISLRIGEFGAAKIYRIEEIEKEESLYPKSQLNQIMKESL